MHTKSLNNPSPEQKLSDEEELARYNKYLKQKNRKIYLLLGSILLLGLVIVVLIFIYDLPIR